MLLLSQAEFSRRLSFVLDELHGLLTHPERLDDIPDGSVLAVEPTTDGGYVLRPLSGDTTDGTTYPKPTI